MEIKLIVHLDKLSESQHKHLKAWAVNFRGGNGYKPTAACRLFQLTDASKNKYGYTWNRKNLTIGADKDFSRIEFYIYSPCTYMIGDMSSLAREIYDSIKAEEDRRGLSAKIISVLGAPEELVEHAEGEYNPCSAFVSISNNHRGSDGKTKFESMSVSKSFH